MAGCRAIDPDEDLLVPRPIGQPIDGVVRSTDIDLDPMEGRSRLPRLSRHRWRERGRGLERQPAWRPRILCAPGAVRSHAQRI